MPRDFLASTCVATLGFAVGYFFADDSPEIRKLRAELEDTKRVRADKERPEPVRFTKGETRFSRGIISGAPGTNGQQNATNDLLVRANVTQEDLQQSLELQRRQDKGEFVLKDELPFLRKVRAYRYKSLAAQAATNNAEAYNRLFALLRLKPDVSEKLQSHLAKIHRASLEAEEAIAQVLDARGQYDQRVRSLLSDEDYSRYRQYEALKPAQSEMDHIERFFRQEKNTVIEPRYKDALVKAIHEFNAGDTGSWHGPYDPLPQVKYGREQAAEWAQGRLKEAQEAAGKVIERIATAGWPDEFRRTLAEYFAEKEGHHQGILHALLDPPDDDDFSPRKARKVEQSLAP